MKPEAEAREKIDALLTLCGWAVQDYARADLSAGRGVALREVFAFPLVKDGMRQCQIEAITLLEISLVNNRPRALNSYCASGIKSRDES